MNVRIKNNLIVFLVTTLWLYVLFLMSFESSLAQSNDNYSNKQIIILDTKSNKKSRDFVKGIEESCVANADILFFDMDGKARKGNEYIDEIKDLIYSKTEKETSLITLGGPSTLMVQSEEINIKTMYAMVGPASIRKIEADNFQKINMTPSYFDQLSNFISILNSPSQIAVLHGKDFKESEFIELQQAGERLNVNILFNEIPTEKELPPAIREIVRLNVPVIFIQDSNIINRNSYKYIVSILTENSIPNLVQSEALTKAGFLFATEAKHYETGIEYGALLCSANSVDKSSIIQNFRPSSFKISINKKSSALIIPKFNNKGVE